MEKKTWHVQCLKTTGVMDQSEQSTNMLVCVCVRACLTISLLNTLSLLIQTLSVQLDPKAQFPSCSVLIVLYACPVSDHSILSAGLFLVGGLFLNPFPER